MTEKPKVEEIRFKNKITGEVISIWIVSYKTPFYWTPAHEFKCSVCNKVQRTYFLFVKDVDSDFGFVSCPNCLREVLKTIRNPESKPIKILFFED